MAILETNQMMFTAFEPKLQNRFLMEIDGIPAYLIKKIARPSITFGGLKKDFLNYTNFKVIGSYFIKGGESPFEFDDINETPRIQLKLEQQIYGALILNYNGYLNVDSQDEKYGQLEEETYGLDIKRRAYSIGAYYKPSNEELGIQFKIFNFGYSGIPDKF